MTTRRIQRKRTKGWRMPENTIYVGRPTKWGNPVQVVNGDYQFAVDCYEAGMNNIRKHQTAQQFDEWLMPLRGKDLACWCPLDKPCHVDILLKLLS